MVEKEILDMHSDMDKTVKMVLKETVCVREVEVVVEDGLEVM